MAADRDEQPTVESAKRSAAGLPSIEHSRRIRRCTRWARSAACRPCCRLNQIDGFDCPSCAWPDPDHRKTAEFCENGAKAVAWEATRKRVGARFLRRALDRRAARAVRPLARAQGRLTEPMYLAPGATHYEPIGWDDALELVAERLRALPDPNRAAFYTSGRTSNEAAFVYQLLARRLGTNNLPDCSNMCHESSGVALNQTLGIGKGNVTPGRHRRARRPDRHRRAEPGHQPPAHARRARAGQAARRAHRRDQPAARGRTDQVPQPADGRAGWPAPARSSPTATSRCASTATSRCSARCNRILLERDDDAPGTVLDRDFIDPTATASTTRPQALARARLRRPAPTEPGCPAAASRRSSTTSSRPKSITVCWAMGLTQHRNAVATIREIVNFLLLRGNIGRPGAGACPVRGHSNVQGDRTMGIWERTARPRSSTRCATSSASSRRASTATTPSTRSGPCATARSTCSSRSAATSSRPLRTPTSPTAAMAAMRADRPGVHQAEPLAPAHRARGADPAVPRPHRARPSRGRRAVRHGRGLDEHGARLARAAGAGLAAIAQRGRDRHRPRATRCSATTSAGRPWATTTASSAGTSSTSSPASTPSRSGSPRPAGSCCRTARATRVRSRQPPARPGSRSTSRAGSTSRPGICCCRRCARTTSSTRPSTAWTTATGASRAGGGWCSSTPTTCARSSLADGDLVDLVSVWADGERFARGFRVVEYATPVGCAAAYFPEANVLVPLDSTAEGSNTPASKSIVIRLERAQG